jgi:hypothetical protein
MDGTAVSAVRERVAATEWLLPSGRRTAVNGMCGVLTSYTTLPAGSYTPPGAEFGGRCKSEPARA